MLEYTEIPPHLNIPPQGNPTYSLANFDEVCKQEMQAGLARIHRQLEQERRKEHLRFLVGLWPIAAGLALACFAPLASELLAPSTSMEMGIVFPFVVLAGRPELHLTGFLAAVLPQFMLYAQFPLEGLVARMASKDRVTLPAITARIACFHVMAALLLLLVSGTIG